MRRVGRLGRPHHFNLPDDLPQRSRTVEVAGIEKGVGQYGRLDDGFAD